MKIIDALKWRYATKRFDESKKVSDADLALLKEAINLSPSSYGLQLYKVLIVESTELREKLKVASWNQPQLTEASHVFVFCNYTQVKTEDIEALLTLKTEVQQLPEEAIQGYGDFMKNTLSAFSDEKTSIWTSKQTYIALGNLLTAAASLEIDACPMEGFEAVEYDRILGLKEKGLQASVVATVGYRSEDDSTQHLPKVRKAESNIFEVL